jgi:hypothetical protein
VGAQLKRYGTNIAKWGFQFCAHNDNAQAEPHRASIAKRFSALAHSGHYGLHHVWSEHSSEADVQGDKIKAAA